MAGSGADRVRFAGFELDPVTGELWSAGVAVPLRPQPRRVLALLVAEAGRAVSRDAIRRAVWDDGVHVDFELGLNSCLAQLRRALGDAAEAPRFIETLPRFGYRFIAPVARAAADSTAPASAQAARWPAAVIAVLGGAAALAPLALFLRGPTVAPTAPVLVVVPFRGTAGDGAAALAAQALTEEATAHVARLAPERLGVIAWTSALQYAKSPLSAAQVGRALRADYVVEGSVALEGGRARAHVWLVRTRDEVALWAGSGEDDGQRPGALGRAVARQLAEAVARTVLGGEATVRARAGTEDEPAYSAYLDGRRQSFLGTADTAAAAVASFEAAIAADPRFAAAHAGLAGALVLDGRRPAAADGVARARREAQRAIALDPDLPDARSALAAVLVVAGDAAGADRAFRTALELNGNDSLTRNRYAGFLLDRGRIDEAEAHNGRARRLNPLCVEARLTAGRILLARGQAAAARRELAAVAAADPSFPPAHEALAQALAAQGRFDEARATLRVALEAGGSPRRVAAILETLPPALPEPPRP